MPHLTGVRTSRKANSLSSAHVAILLFGRSASMTLFLFPELNIENACHGRGDSLLLGYLVAY